MCVVTVMTLCATANTVMLDANSAVPPLLTTPLMAAADGGAKGLLPPLELPPMVDAGPSPSDADRFVPPPGENSERLPSEQHVSEPPALNAALDTDGLDGLDGQAEAKVESNQPAQKDADSASDPSEPSMASPPACITEDEVWQINTRHLGTCCPHPTPHVFIHQQNRWRPRTLEDILAPFDGVVVIFVHGNRMEQCNTLNRGLLYYRCLTAGPGPKVRFIIWSWPSDKIKGQVKDIRVKACRADAEGGYLAWYLNQLDPHQPISLIGYSYGARTISSALHLRAYGGNATFPLRASNAPMRVVINAPAMSNCDMSSRGRYRGMMTQVDRMLMLYNSTDPILKRYRIVEKGARPAALGYTGLTCPIPGGNKIRQINASPVVGRSHYEPKYLQHRPFLNEMRRCLLWEPMP